MRRAAVVALVAVAAGCGGGPKAAPLPSRCRLGVYFRHDATRAQIDAVRAKLAEDKHVTQVVFISKQDAWHRFRRQHPVLAQRTPTNPLPDAVFAHPRTRDDYAKIARTLQPRPPGVQTVHYPRFGPCA